MPAKGGGFQRGHKPHHPTVKRRLEEEGVTGFEAGMGGAGQTDVKMLDDVTTSYITDARDGVMSTAADESSRVPVNVAEFTVDIGKVVVVNNALLNDKVDLV